MNGTNVPERKDDQQSTHPLSSSQQSFEDNKTSTMPTTSDSDFNRPLYVPHMEDSFRLETFAHLLLPKQDHFTTIYNEGRLLRARVPLQLLAHECVQLQLPHECANSCNGTSALSVA